MTASTAVNVEAVYGRALLDEVAAVTELLAGMHDDLRAFMVRARGASGRARPLRTGCWRERLTGSWTA